MEDIETLVGRGREAIDFIIDPDTFVEGKIGDVSFDDPEYGPGAVVGTAKLSGEECTVIASDAMTFNEKFPVVYGGIIGMEEGYKMAKTVYASIAADADKEKGQKRPLLLLVDTPGNGPGKVEEIVGMNKATGAYQLALAEARLKGHPVIAMVIGRAISGAFLCHGLQADHILSLDANFGTMIHVMPLTSISRITRKDLETLEELSSSNPVFAAGPRFFYQLGGVEELITSVPGMRDAIIAHIAQVRDLKAQGKDDEVGPWGRGKLGKERGGRTIRDEVITLMNKQFSDVADRYMPN